MKLKRKRICAVLLAVFLVLLCSCRGEEQECPQEERRGKIVIWAWDETFNVKAAELAAREYGQSHEEVQIVVEAREREEILEDTRKLLAAGLYEKLPDIIMLEDYDVQAVLAQYEDEFVDLTERLDRGRFVEYKNRLCSRNGKMYGIPFDSGTAALFYRIDILEQAGFSEEDMENLTWEKYMEIGRRVYERTGIPMLTLDPTDFPLVRLVMQSCGSWYVKEDGSSVNIAGNDALKQALEIYRQLLRENIGISVNGWNEFISAFQKGEVATVLSGGWIISSIKENEEQAGLWRIAAIPRVSQNEGGGNASNVGGSAWYVLKNAAGAEQAAAFAVEMFGENDAFIDRLVKEIGLIPTIKNPQGLSCYEAEDTFFGGQQVTKLLTKKAADIPVVDYGSRTYEIENILEEEFQDVLPEGSIEECLERVEMKAAAIARE